MTVTFGSFGACDLFLTFYYEKFQTGAKVQKGYIMTLLLPSPGPSFHNYRLGATLIASMSPHHFRLLSTGLLEAIILK